MSQSFQFVLDGDAIHFTPDGRIHVLNAIGALCGSDKEKTEGIWKTLKSQNSKLNGCCRKYRFSGGDVSPAANSEEWEMIEKVLFEHILDEEIDFLSGSENVGLS